MITRAGEDLSWNEMMDITGGFINNGGFVRRYDLEEKCNPCVSVFSANVGGKTFILELKAKSGKIYLENKKEYWAMVRTMTEAAMIILGHCGADAMKNGGAK